MSEQIKLKIDLHNGVVELEASEAFTKTELPKLLELLKAKAKQRREDQSEDEAETSGDKKPVANGKFKNISDFIAIVNPETNNEIVATCAYYWAFCDKEHGAEFKNNEVLGLYTGPIRRNKPARASNLCSDAANQSGWIRAGSKMGRWQISDLGQKYIEGKIKK